MAKENGNSEFWCEARHLQVELRQIRICSIYAFPELWCIPYGSRQFCDLVLVDK